MKMLEKTKFKLKLLADIANWRMCKTPYCKFGNYRWLRPEEGSPQELANEIMKELAGADIPEEDEEV